VRSSNFNGPSPLVNHALRAVENNIFFEGGSAASNAQDQLSALEECVRKGEALDDRGALLKVWTQYTDALNELLERAFRSFTEIGAANPEYVGSDPAQWAAELLRPHVNDLVNQAHSWFVPGYAALLNDVEETNASLLTDFYVEITNSLARLEHEAIIGLARRGWKKPPREAAIAEPASNERMKSVTEGTVPEKESPSELQFTLSDLGDPPEGTSKDEIVCYLHKRLKAAIKESRSWIDREDQKGQKLSNENLCDRFPILRDASGLELQKLAERKITPHNCSIEIMHGRMSNVALDTVKRYLRPMRRKARLE
jgi:hypothetical protein